MHVAGDHIGMNLHLSGLVSDILETLVETIEGGEEVISTEDFLAKEDVDALNNKMEGWDADTWWMVEGQGV